MPEELQDPGAVLLQWQKDLKKAYEKIKGKRTNYDLYFSYYDGDHPLVYSTDRLRKVFNNINAKFVENWIQVVVDAPLDRIRLKRFVINGGNEAVEKRINQIFVDSELNLDAWDCHLAALVTGEGFIIAWVGEDGEIEAYYNDPRMVHVEYFGSRPREKRYAAKLFLGEDGKARMTLYYKDRFVRFMAGSDKTNKASDFKFEGEEINPYGVIPVFHFRKERRKIKGEIQGVISIQDAINKLLADMMVAAEFGAFRQRWIISNADTESLKNAPNEIWSIPSGDGVGQNSQVGDFAPTDLDNYLKAIGELSSALAIISRTPKHFFYGQGGDPSGEALIALEGPLNDKCELYIDRLKAEWRKVIEFIGLLEGLPIERGGVEPIFAEPQTVQPLTRAQIRKTNTEANIPVRTILRVEEGWTDQEIEDMEEDRRIESEAQQNSLARAVLDAVEETNAGGQSTGMEQGTETE